MKQQTNEEIEQKIKNIVHEIIISGEDFNPETTSSYSDEIIRTVRLSTIQEVEGKAEKMILFNPKASPVLSSEMQTIGNELLSKYVHEEKTWKKGYNQALSDVLQVLASMKGLIS